MMHDVSLQRLWDGMYCNAHVRPYVHWIHNTSIPIGTEAKSNLKQKSLISNVLNISITFIKHLK